MKINNFDIDISDMPTERTVRQFTVSGEKGAEFEIVALKSGTLQYYDFIDNSFALGHNDLHNNLRIKLTNLSYVNSIIFPSGGGDYIIKLMAINDTEISSYTSFVINKSISKAAANTTVTFTPGTTAANAANYATLPTSTSVGAVDSTGVVSFDWDVTNSSTDAKSHGLRITDPTITIDDNYWYFKTTENVLDNPAGDGVASTTAQVASLTDLAVGMELTFHKGTTAPSASTRIRSIDTDTKIITFSTAVAFEDGETMTFKAYGSRYINAAIGLDLLIKGVTFEGEKLTTTVRATVSASTTVTLDATNGIGGGNFIGYTGVGVNNASTNKITSVTPDPDAGDGSLDGDGAMVVQLAQTLSADTVLTFIDIHKIINFAGSISITKYPTANKTIYLDLEKIITLGVAS